MLQLITAALFVGYTLVYAAVANGGKFAESPWRALREDAYTGAPLAAAAGDHGVIAKGGSSTWHGFKTALGIGEKIFLPGGFLP